MKHLFLLLLSVPLLAIAQPDTFTNAVRRIEWKYNNANYSPLQIGKFTVAPNKYMGVTAANTGLCINPLTNQIISCVYNYAQASLVYIFNRSGLPVYSSSGTITPVPASSINITALVDHIEGLWFDKTTGLYYTYSTIKGAAVNDTNRVVVCFDSNGNRVKPDRFPDFAGQAGMITGRADRLLLKPQNKGFWKEYNKSDFSLQRTVTADANEGICVDELTGDIWTGTDDTIKRYDYVTGIVKESFANPAKEIEGMACDRADGTIWLNADKYLHGGTNNGNTLFHYDFDKTYKKFVRFPEMISWSAGALSGSLLINNNALYGNGSWESPVMDFKTYTDYLNNAPSVTQDGKTITYQYRGSNTAPGSVVNNEMPVSYYPSWGSTAPSAYSSSVSSYRYQQIKITIACKAPVLSANLTHVTCNGYSNGAIDLVVTGGSAPYTYAWSNGAATEDINGLQASSYNVVVTGASGCQATASYTITQPAALSPISNTAAACDSYTWAVNGVTYTASGTYTATIGCQPYTLSLTITPSTSTEETAVACGSYTWNGTTYTTSGDYVYTSGCSTSTLHLTIVPISSSEETTSACGSYTWHGNLYTESGDYIYTVACNSITLHLTIVPAATTEETVSAIDSFAWHGVTYIVSGDYTDITGCTTSVLHLTIIPSTTTEETARGCDSYNWYGTTYIMSGDYTNINGAATHVLHLTITPSTITEQTISSAGSYTWHGTTYSTPGDYSFTNDCNTDILHLSLTPPVVSEETDSICSSYTWHGTTYTTSGNYVYTNGIDTTILHLTIIPGPVVAAVPGIISCNGGTTSVVLSASGGKAPYAGTGTLTSQAAGAHTYSVTDSRGCIASKTITIAQPLPFSATAVPGTMACYGGRANVTVSGTGGTPSYTSTGIKGGQTAGPHSYTITDANGCKATATTTVVQPPLLVVTVSADRIGCVGATTTVTVSAKGGTPPSSGAGTYTGQNAGTHTYTVTDANGCSVSKSITLDPGTWLIPASPSSINGLAYNLCKGGTFKYSVQDVSGAKGYTWTLPAGFTATAGQGTKNITVKVPANFTGQDTMRVTAFNSCGASQPTLQPVYAVVSNSPENLTGLDAVTGGQSNVQYSVPASSGFTYNWSVPAGTSIISGRGTAVVKLQFGNVSGEVKVAVSNSCGSALLVKYVTVNGTMARKAVTAPPAAVESKMKVYPNPAQNLLKIAFGVQQKGVRYELRISEMNGKTIISQTGLTTAGNNTILLNISRLAHVTYLVTLVTDQTVQIEKVEKVE